MDDTDEHQLFADEFTPADQSEMADLHCGEEPWSRAATEWIQGSDVFDSINTHSTSVWVYRNTTDVVIGFASLAPTRDQKWPPPDGPKTRLLYIPQLGVDVKYRGQPTDPNWRYSTQIMRHLIFQAQRMALEIRENKPPRKHVELLTLKVHRENLAAQKVYQRFGFELLSDFEDREHLMMSHKLNFSPDE